jgi:hypothetical protein
MAPIPVTDTQAVVNELGGSMLLAFYLPRILAWLKVQSWFPFLEDGRRHINRLTAVLVALGSAMGLHWGFSHGDTGWQFIIGGPQMTIVGFLVDFARQFAAQQFFYEHQSTGGPDTGLGSVRRTITMLLIVVLPLSMLSLACASAPTARHAAVVIDTAVYDALAAAQDGADGLLKAEVITPAQRRQFSTHLLPALNAGRDLVHITQRWQPGAPAPADFIALVRDVQALIADVGQSLPTSAQSRMLPKLNAAAQQLLDLFVKFSGGEPPPSLDALAASFGGAL